MLCALYVLSLRLGVRCFGFHAKAQREITKAETLSMQEIDVSLTAGFSERLNTTLNALPRRIILLGASNVRLGLPVAIATARRVWGGPLDVLAACGLGRSYGRCRLVLGRALPGIRECGLWEALNRRPIVPTAALITDVGNDLLYEVPVPEIVAWVRECVDRLLESGAKIVLTPLPLCNITTLSRSKFLLLRSILFPRCRFTLATVRERALDLDERLRDLARQRNLVLAEHRPEWYGFDPIHVRWRHRSKAWQEMLGKWPDAAPPPHPTLSPSGGEGRVRGWLLRHSLYVHRLTPERHWLFGRERHQVQPAGILPDGTKISLY
jgi:hypothetical protein